LEVLRGDIDRIDAEILSLIAKRNEVAAEIGLTKRKDGVKARDPEREKIVLRLMEKRAKALGIDKHLARQLTKMLINDSVRIQKSERRNDLEGQKVLVVGGSGKMGEWMCRFMSNRGAEVRVWDPRGKLPGHVQIKSLLPTAKTADIIVIASPLGATPEELVAVINTAPEGVVFDLCSVKSHIFGILREAAAEGIKVTSVHPMFGPRTPSPDGLNVLICDCGCDEANEKVAIIFSKAGARTKIVELEEHDKLMAFALGLPHVTALLFAGTARMSDQKLEGLMDVRGTSFVRLAALAREVSGESKRIYHDIQALNPHTQYMFEAMEEMLAELKQASIDKDPISFGNLMQSVKEYMEG